MHRSEQPSRLPPLWLLIAVTAVGPASLHIILPSLPRLAVDFASDYGSAQLALTVYLAAMAPAQLIYGPLSDRFGRRPLLLMGMLGYLIGTALCVLAWSLEAMLVGRVIQAFGGCAGMVLSRAIVRDVHDREQSAGLIAHITMAMSLAPMFSPALGGWLEEWVGWRAGFVLLGIAGAGGLAWAWYGLNETNQHRTPINPRALARNYALLLRSPGFVGYTLGTSFATASWYAFTAGAPYLLVDAMGQAPSAYGAWVLLVMGGYTIGNLFAARISPRVGVDGMIWLGLLAAVIGTAGLAIWTGFWELTPLALFVPMMVLTLGHGLGQPNGIAGAISVHPQIAGSASGLLGFVQMAVSAITTLLLATFQAPVAFPTVVVVVVSVVLSTLAFSYAILTQRRAAKR